MTTRNSLRTSMASATALIVALLIQHPALSQTAPAAAASEELEEVMVTGSRIVRRDLVSPSPIKTVDEHFFQDSGQVTIEAALQQLPQFQAGSSANTNNVGGGGRFTLNLRGLGDNRNLVLLDGRRLPLSSAFGQVDVTLIPPSVLRNVETITGGASAVYGSDAISGVVNFLPRKKLDGVMIDIALGNSAKSDHKQADISITAGTEFAGGRGNSLVALAYSSREMFEGLLRPEIYALMTPSSFIGHGAYLAAGTNQPSQAAVNTLFTRYGFAGVPASGNFGFNSDGTLFNQNGAQNYKGPVDATYALIGGNVRFPAFRQQSMLAGVNRYSLYAGSDYELTPNATAYTQLLYTDSSVLTDAAGSRTQFSSASSPFLSVPVTNPFIPADLSTLLASRPTPAAPFRLNGRYVGVHDERWDEGYATAQILGGVRGKFGYRDWTWDVYVSGDKTRHTQTQLYAVLRSRVQTLLNAADGGRSICAGGFNPFGLNNAISISTACANYIQTTVTNVELLDQTVAEASTQGSLLSMPAGDLQFALTADYRKNGYRFRPDAEFAAGDVESVVGGLASKGETKVKEYAAELRVPVLRNLPLAHSLAFDLAYRYSDYNTSGGTSTFKIDAEWSPVASVLVRGGYSRAIRAPNIGELFSAATGGQVAFGSPPSGGEPCDSRSAARAGANAARLRQLCIDTGIPAAVVANYIFATVAAASVSSGNPNLKPETADTYTAGVVFTPTMASPLFSKLSVSVDYYSIDIKDVIGPIAGLSALNKCYNLDGSNPTYSASNVYCALLTRDSGGQLSLIRAPYLNLGGLKTKGLDIALNWSIPLSAMGLSSSGVLKVGSDIGLMNSYETAIFPGDAFVNSAGTNSAQTSSLPKTKHSTTFGYQQGATEIALNWQYLAAMTDRSKLSNPASTVVGSKAYSKFDLTGRYQFNNNLEVRAAISNLFDKTPPFAASGSFVDPAVYDIVGRAFTVGARFKF